jgi:gas vesicle protein
VGAGLRDNSKKEIAQMEDNSKLSYFFLGLGVGVAAGILFAPKSGAETRGYLVTKADEGREYVKRQSSALRESASDLYERGRDAVTRQRDQVAAAVDAGTRAYREAVSEPGTQG